MELLKNPQIPEKMLKTLINMGFSVNQSAVYLASLKLGNASIWDIAEISGVKRTTCYVVMRELIVKGLASVTTDGKRATYNVTSPNDLYFNFANRQEQLRGSINELNTLASHSSSKPQVRMLEGIEGVEQAYQLPLSLPEGSEVLIYGNPEVYINYPEMVQRYVAQRVSRKISVRTIIADTDLGSAVTKNDIDILRQTRVLPRNKFDQKTEVNILPNKILYLAHSDNKPFATVIESLTLAKEERSRFELLWEIAKPINKS